MTSPTTWITNNIKKHTYQVRIFCMTFLMGFLVHFYMFSNKFYNYFEMNNILTPMSIDKGDTLAMGRWLLPAVSSLSSVFSMPAVNGMICLISLSLITCMVVDILKIRRTLLAALTGGIIVSFPGVASYLSYGVNSDVFCVSLLLSVASAWVLHHTGCVEYISQKKNDKKNIEKHEGNHGTNIVSGKQCICGMMISAVLLCCCIGVYQPFMSVTIALIFCMLFLQVWEEGKGFLTILKQVVGYVIVLAVGFILYYVILQIVTAVLGIDVGDYHGVNEIASFTLKGIAKGGVYTYIYFLRYLFSTDYTNGILLTIFDVAAGCLFLFYTIRGYQLHRKGEREKGSLICQILLIAFLPIGVNASPFLMADRVGNGVDRYMMFSMMLLFVLLLKLMDSMALRADEVNRTAKMELERFCRKEKLGYCHTVLQWLTLASVIALIWSDAYLCNQGYFRAEAMTSSENALLNRLAYRLETSEDWTLDTPVFFANCEALFNENYDTEIDAFDAIAILDGTEIKPWYNYDAVAKYMQTYLNFQITKPNIQQQEAILASEELKRMGLYPAADSIQMIDGVLVVKFNETEE